MKICPECNHENTDYAEICEKCLTALKSEKKIVKIENFISDADEKIDFFLFAGIINMLIVLYGVVISVIELILVQRIEFSSLIYIALGGLGFVYLLEIKNLRNQITELQKVEKSK